MQYGTRVQGKIVQKNIPAERNLATALAADPTDLTVAGGIYQIDLHTNGAPDPQGAINQILSFEQTEPDLRFVHINADSKSKVITIQFMDIGPGQFSFTGLLSSMPFILGLVFIVVVGYVLYTVYASNATLFWILLFLGVGIAFFFVTSAVIKPGTVPIFKPKDDKTRTATEKEQRETNLRRQLDIYESRIATADRNIENYESKIEKAKKNEKEAITARYEPLIARAQQEREEAQANMNDVLSKLS